MKKLLFSSLMLIIAFSACKKDDDSSNNVTPTPTGVVITSSDLGSAGDSMLMNVDTTNLTGFSLGVPGQNVTWDFSTLGVDRIDTNAFLAPANTPGGTYFASSNLAMEVSTNPSIYMYLSKTTDKVEGLGMWANVYGNEGHAEYSDKPIMMKFPMQYNSAFIDSGALSLITSYQQTYIKIEMKQTIDSKVDASGTLKLPNNASYSCIREKRTEINNQNIYMSSSQFGPWMPYQSNADTSYTYCFYAKNQKWDVCDVSVKDFTTNTINSISYKK